MPIWEAELFMNSKVGRINVAVEAATYEGARQQIDQIYGRPQQVVNLHQAAGSENLGNNHQGDPSDLGQLSNKIGEISDDISELLELEQSRALDQSHKEYKQAYEEVWKALNDEAEYHDREPISYKEMQLMHGDPFDDKIVGMSGRKRVDGKVIIECIHCNQTLRINDGRRGVIHCANCEQDFFTDTTIEYDPRNDGKEENSKAWWRQIIDNF